MVIRIQQNLYSKFLESAT